MKHISIVALLAVSAPVLAETNYCHDPKVGESWEQIKRNHRGEHDIEGLAALRERLCGEVNAGAITVREATERFEAERAMVIEERREHNRGQEAGGSDHLAIERLLERSSAAHCPELPRGYRMRVCP